MRSVKLGLVAAAMLLGTTALTTPAFATSYQDHTCQGGHNCNTGSTGGNVDVDVDVDIHNSNYNAGGHGGYGEGGHGGYGEGGHGGYGEGGHGGYGEGGHGGYGEGGQGGQGGYGEGGNGGNNTTTNNANNSTNNTANNSTNNNANNSTNNNANNQSSANNNGNNNGSHNKFENKQDQDQHQYQHQGQHQSINDSGNSYNENDNSNSNNANLEVNTYNQRAPVNTAYAAGLSVGEDTCMGSSSIGAQAVSFGLSLGTTWQDDNCRRLKNSRQLVALGYHRAATSLMCVDEDVRQAMIMAGTPCPNGEVVAVVAPPVAAPPAREYVPMAPVADERPAKRRHRVRKPLPPK